MNALFGQVYGNIYFSSVLKHIRIYRKLGNIPIALAQHAGTFFSSVSRVEIQTEQSTEYLRVRWQRKRMKNCFSEMIYYFNSHFISAIYFAAEICHHFRSHFRFHSCVRLERCCLRQVSPTKVMFYAIHLCSVSI